MQLHRFHLIWLRLVVSLIASIDININGHWYLMEKALVSPMFYLAFLLTFAISYLLLYFIHCVNHRLDHTHPWNFNWRSRAIRQTVFGIMCPALVDLTIIVTYFLLAGRRHKLGDHIYYEYPRVVLFIVTINLVYAIISFVKQFGSSKTELQVLVIKHNGVDIKINPETDVLFVCKSGRNIKIYMISGNVYTKRDTISSFNQGYKKSGFLQVNPSVIINLRMLEGSAKGTRSKTLEPLFKAQFQDRISQSDLEKLRVTREYLNNFKKEIKKYLAGDAQI